MRQHGVGLGFACLFATVFYFAYPFLLPDALVHAAEQTGGAPTTAKPFSDNVIIATMIVLGVLVVGILAFMWALQRRYYQGCVNEKQMALFSESPSGLPTGTVRSMIAFSVVIVSLYFIALQVMGQNIKFPEVLSSLLGAVIGFYFGNRSASGDKGMQKQVEDLKQQRDKAVAEKDGDKASDLLKKAKKGVALTKKVLKYLPEENQKQYEKFIGKLEQGVDAAEKLNNVGMVSDAVNKAQEAFKEFVGKNPVKELIEKASTSFKMALGVSVPQVALVLAVVGAGAGLAGLGYQKWKARVLRAPFSPAELPLKTIDANTGFSLLIACPSFKQAFMPELQGNDRPFMQSVIDLSLREADTDAIYAKYQDRFASREEFEQGLEEFRFKAADRELNEMLSGKEVLQQFGGYEGFIGMIDKIHKDDKALADLDAVVTVAENLQNEGEPVVEVFNKASKELQE